MGVPDWVALPCKGSLNTASYVDALQVTQRTSVRLVPRPPSSALSTPHVKGWTMETPYLSGETNGQGSVYV